MKKFSWTYKIGLVLGVLIVVWIAAASALEYCLGRRPPALPASEFTLIGRLQRG